MKDPLLQKALDEETGEVTDLRDLKTRGLFKGRYVILPLNGRARIYLSSCIQTLGEGERIEIRGFGSFSLRYRPERRAHNPKTGETVYTVAKYTPHFKPGKDLRERVNNNRHLYPVTIDISPLDPNPDSQS